MSKQEMTMKYSIFYPETGERVPGVPEFDKALAALKFWDDARPGYCRLESQGNDLATLLNPRNGVIVVIRAVTSPTGQEAT
jgi:hypothetical protein